MSSKYFILSFMAFCVALFLIFKNYEVWTYPIEWVPEKEGVKKSEKKPETPTIIEGQRENSSVNPYILIAEKNIFSPERKEFPIPATAETKKPLVRPQVVLYGVTIAEDYQSASIVNPGRPLKKGERETMTLKLGERIGEYKMTKILSNRITLEAQGDTFEVLLYDPKMPKKGLDTKAESKPIAIASTPPTPAPTPEEASKPAPPKEDVERPKGLVQEKNVTPPQVPRPVRPTFPPPEIRRGRRMVYPPAGSPTQETGGN